jgi:hypothetical protein
MNSIASLMRDKHYLSSNYSRDVAIFSKIMPIEEMKEKYNPRDSSVLYFTNSAQTNISKFKKNDYEEISNLFMILLPDNIPNYLSDRVYTMTDAFINFDDYTVNLLSKGENTFAYLPDPINAYLFQQIKRYSNINKNMIDYYINRPKLRLFTISGIFTLTILCASLLLSKWMPRSALFSLFILYQIPFILLTIPTGAFRYLYFVYLGGIFVIPLMLMELRTNKIKQEV